MKPIQLIHGESTTLCRVCLCSEANQWFACFDPFTLACQATKLKLPCWWLLLRSLLDGVCVCGNERSNWFHNETQSALTCWHSLTHFQACKRERNWLIGNNYASWYSGKLNHKAVYHIASWCTHEQRCFLWLFLASKSSQKYNLRTDLFRNNKHMYIINSSSWRML